ncbi:MAG: hypothetical protein LBS50_02075 [Prevotellaceae bacterium]|jgi:riboflavin kinase/FMN adenylyltransferase|nr:hypothetical protein [Prevotellaceae bacterium]
MIFLSEDSEILDQNVIATIGFFDGVHRGHQFFLKTLAQQAKKYSLKSMVVTFTNHPKLYFYPNKTTKLLTLLIERFYMLNNFKIDYCLVLDFDAHIAKMTGEEFIQFLKKKFGLKNLMVGMGNHFGCDRVMFPEIKEICERENLYIYKVNHFTLSNQRKISSTFIRKCLKFADVESANEMLDRNYSIYSTIEGKRQLQNSIIELDLTVDNLKLLPRRGVYLAEIEVDKMYYKCVLDIPDDRDIEDVPNSRHIFLYIFGLKENALSFYSKNVEIGVIYFLRENFLTEGIDSIDNQLVIDREWIFGN